MRNEQEETEAFERNVESSNAQVLILAGVSLLSKVTTRGSSLSPTLRQNDFDIEFSRCCYRNARAMAYSDEMQHVLLYDHHEEHLRRLREEREQRYQQARMEYQLELRAYDEEVAALAETYRTGFRRLRVFQGTGAWWRHRRLLKRGDPVPPLPEGPTAEEQRRQAEAEAEQRLASDLLTALPGAAWTLLKGYQNEKGDIDYLLIGPVGVLALKCQHLSGTIICTKDRWIRQKYDPKGAPVTQVPILDRTGRTPSRQLDEAVTALIQSLSRKDVHCEIASAVILTHHDVRLSTVEASTVQILLLSNLQPMLWEMCRSASSTIPTERIVECVKEDYSYWQERKGITLQQQHGSCA